MTTRLLPALLALAALAPGASRAEGPACGAHAEIVERLAEGWGESRQSIGLAGEDAVVETFASPETGTWTITVTRPGGPTCLVASGIGFELVAEALDRSQGA